MTEAFNTSLVGYKWTVLQEIIAEDKLQSKKVVMIRCVSWDILDFLALVVFSSLSLDFPITFSAGESGSGYV